MTAIPAPTTPAPAGSHYETQNPRSPQVLLDNLAPAAKQTQLGAVCVDLITQVNYLVADIANLRTKYQALLAHLDTANVAGIGNANVATYGDVAETAAAIQQLGAR